MFPGSANDSLARWCLARIMDAIGRPPLQLCFADRVRVSAPDSRPIGAIRIADWPTLLRLALEPEYQFGEAFSRGRVDVDGDLAEALCSIYRSSGRDRHRILPTRLRSTLYSWLQANSRRGSRRNIHHHYDLSTDFYRLWLDRQLVYTGAYFAEPQLSLEDAQIRKLDHVCRKLRLTPGDSVVEAGCGWGALALHMARHYGARVRAFNISHEQIAWARERARLEGLADRVEFVEDDYRNIRGRFDVFVSVGMLEHVGPRHYARLAAVIDHGLTGDGRVLLHFIGRNQRRRLNTWIRRRIFPGAYPPTLREALEPFERVDYSVLDVENLRLHYAFTLEHWLRRFERSADRIRFMYGEELERAWRLYLAGSAASFRTGSLQLFQVVLTRGACNRIPWTRAHLYQTVEADEPWTHAMS